MNGSSVKQIVQRPFFLPVLRPFLNFDLFLCAYFRVFFFVILFFLN